MKKTLLMIVAALVVASPMVDAQNKIDKQGRRQGHWMRTDKDGAKIFEGTFKDGLETGVFTYYYHDGNVRMRNTYIVPGKVCRHEAFDEQGHLLADGYYNQRNRDSIWHFYATDGRLVKQAAYRMGVKHGQHIVFNQTGDTAEVATWSDNRRHGRWWKRIGKNGYITATYIKGGIEGRLVEYDEHNKLTREGFYEDGYKHGSYRYYENGDLTIDEQWQHGMMLDRRIRLLLPEAEFVSIHDIVCIVPQGKNRVIFYLSDGSKKVSRENPDLVFERIGNELFATANSKSRIVVATHNVQGLGADNEGREILLLDPQPDINIYPDEDGLKMVQSRSYEDSSPLDQLTR
ncbi:MAG: hypothetical protein IJ761_04505 [Bacteroidales bacterium]|nr:hypothetical protein [Bacteroidales bacterium]